MSDQLNTYLNDFFYQGNVCPECNKGISIKNTEESTVFACSNCSTLSYKQNNKFTFERRFAKKVAPLLPIGTKCQIDGLNYEVIGYRYLKEQKFSFYWKEYTLHHPSKDHLYLAEYNGHWTKSRMLPASEKIRKINTKVFLQSDEFDLFNRYSPLLMYGEGEFDSSFLSIENRVYSEYAGDGRMLISEKISDDQFVWYLGEYQYPDQIKTLFPKVELPKRVGVGAIQPFMRHLKPNLIVKLGLMVAAILTAFQILLSFSASEKVLYNQAHQVIDSSGFVAPIVTPGFKIENSLFGRTNLEYHLWANISNNWFETDVILVNDDTDEEIGFQEGVEYYSGYDWSEGSTRSSSTISEVPDGNYHMVITSYSDRSATTLASNYEIKLIQDVPMWSNYFILLALIAIYPIVIVIASNIFEGKRWSQSDWG
jgi:DNA-directed RNA polymerase subunit M/transcription elongation factor TFIIS